MAPQPQPSGTPGRERGECGGSPLHAGTCPLPACWPRACPPPALPRAPLQGQEQPPCCRQGLVPGPGAGRGPSWGPMPSKRRWGTELARDTFPWQHGAPVQPRTPQPQWDLWPPALSPPPRHMIYGLCAGSQMAKENRAGGSCPAGGRGAVCSQPAGTGGQQTGAGAGGREHGHPCRSPSSDKPWHTRGDPRGGTHWPEGHLMTSGPAAMGRHGTRCHPIPWSPGLPPCSGVCSMPTASHGGRPSPSEPPSWLFLPC